jgi:hypothetical protein
MKHLSKIIISCFAVILLLAGCSNIFAPDTKSGETGLRITISNGVESRTLFPNANFTRYELRFEGPNSEDFTEPLGGGQESIIMTDLAPGLWTIVVTRTFSINA